MNVEGYNGSFYGRTLVQKRGSIGGARDVFVKLADIKNDLVFPTFGGRIMNPFKGVAKIYAGDLIEYRTDDKGVNPEIYLLKTYQVAKNSSSETTFQIVRDGYKHVPFVGDILMKAPDSIDGTGAGYTVTAVVAKKGGDTGKEDVWEITVKTTLGELNKGDILVEAKEENASAKMLVQNINAVAPCDYDFLYENVSNPADEEDEFDAARYFMTPALGGLMYRWKMSPVPKCVEVFNKATVNGWFKISH